ncbi:amino acid ABC transporter ATP-binding protein [Labedella populi]|uniref:ABC-type polar-amino-acid transporter n=1 Tax=Labedella populi TaxID=2498850 RepID=A0A3S4A2K1_9MICO|nr:amino acid ABC transporter ATP-binding protein [Labedella populi]RWZ68350.1 amino acid ABC transporter ATP-binding protein [Labedella populi]
MSTTTTTTTTARAVSGPMVDVREVRKHFGHIEVLKSVDLAVQPGEVCCLLGRSGSGKSTLLRCINQLESIDAGEIFVAGERIGYEEKRGKLHPLSDRAVARQRRSIGMVFQRFNLFSHMTALDNIIESPTGVLRTSRSTAKARALELLDRVGLADRADHYPRQLSGGQQQRVAIARALAMDPAVMLFDEPTSALDPELVGDVLGVMRDLAADGMTMVVVTHEIGFAREVADTVVFLDGGEVVERGAASEVLTAPEHASTQAFLSRVLREEA